MLDSGLTQPPHLFLPLNPSHSTLATLPFTQLHAATAPVHFETMADQPQNQLFSTFPNPPSFLWKDFTDENLARLADAKKAWEAHHPEAASSFKAVTLLPDLPDDLIHLQPPAEPLTGSWKALGGTWTVRCPAARHHPTTRATNKDRCS